MADSNNANEESLASRTKSAEKSPPRRQIPGNLPYLTASGTLKTILNKIIELAKPDKFNYDFLNNVIKLSGGGARACIPILKKMEFLNSDNSTTELYNKFRTESGRSAAAYQGLRNGFPEIFKRSDYAYSVDENKLRDIILEITGLNSSDQVAQAIKATFNVVKSFISKGFDHNSMEESVPDVTLNKPDQTPAGYVPEPLGEPTRSIGIAYNINIVLPETSDLAILNAIFKAVKENLLR